MMDNMDSTTKSVLIGLGTAVAVGVGIAGYFMFSDNAQEKTKALVNRQRAKHYVSNKFNDNKKAKKSVDKLSDTEVNNLLGAVDKANDLENQFSDAVSDVGDFFSKQTKKAKKKLN